MQLSSVFFASTLKGGFESFTVLCSDVPLVFIIIVSSPCIYYVSSPVRFYSFYWRKSCLLKDVFRGSCMHFNFGYCWCWQRRLGTGFPTAAVGLLLPLAAKTECIDRTVMLRMLNAFCACTLLSIVYLNFMKSHQHASLPRK